MAGTLTPITRWQIMDAGVIAPGAKLYTYESGTATPLATYNDADLAIGHVHTNPVVADAEGVLPVIFLLPQAYRFLVTDADGVTIFPAQDDVTSFGEITEVQAANMVYAGPTAGVPATPTFRALVTADLPTPATEAANQVYAGPTSGADATPDFRALVAADLPSVAVRVLDRDVTLATVTNTVAETTVYTKQIDAGLLSTNRMLRLTMICDFFNDTGGNADVTIRAKYGATTVFSGAPPATPATSGTRRPMRFQLDICAYDSASAQVAVGELWYGNNVGVTGIAGTPASSGDLVGVHAGVAENSATALNLVVTAQLSTTSASLTFRAHTVQVELL